MDKIGSSFTFFFLFLMEWPLLVCLPYAEKPQPSRICECSSIGFVVLFPRVGGKVQSQVLCKCFVAVKNPTPMHIPEHNGVREGVTSEPTNENMTAHWMALNTDTSEAEAVLIPHRPVLMEVITIACVALSIALVCGTAVSYMLYRRAQAEQKQQLVSLYRNIKIPLLGEEEDGFKDECKDESNNLCSENEEQLANFINSGRKSTSYSCQILNSMNAGNDGFVFRGKAKWEFMEFEERKMNIYSHA
ncbi:uncharacterized protein C19orf18 homolog [Rhynchonycteris naso]